jgi:hypothetical protein
MAGLSLISLEGFGIALSLRLFDHQWNPMASVSDTNAMEL